MCHNFVVLLNHELEVEFVVLEAFDAHQGFLPQNEVSNGRLVKVVDSKVLQIVEVLLSHVGVLGRLEQLVSAVLVSPVLVSPVFVLVSLVLVSSVLVLVSLVPVPFLGRLFISSL